MKNSKNVGNKGCLLRYLSLPSLHAEGSVCHLGRQQGGSVQSRAVGVVAWVGIVGFQTRDAIKETLSSNINVPT